MSPYRIFQAKAVRNFRDAGGWPIGNNDQMAHGKLLRSGHWADASDEDLSSMQKAGLQVLIDLRRPSERSKQPNRLPQGHELEIMQTMGGDHEEAPHIRFLKAGILNHESVRAYMFSAYERIPGEAHHQQLFRQAIEQLAAGKVVLIHCAAGKDRTGILSALILQLLGASEEAVIEDYLMTNKAVNLDALLPDIAARISEETGRAIEPRALLPMLGVEADMLQRARKVMGNAEQYAQEQLGLQKEQIMQLRTALIDSSKVSRS